MKTSNKLLPKAETFEISSRHSNFRPTRTDRVQFPKIDFMHLIVFLSFSLFMLMSTNTYADNNECGVGYNNFLNNRDSKINFHPNYGAFAALKADGSITAWGHTGYGGSGAPTDSGYVSIVSAQNAFAALKADGSITAWGHTSYGGSGAPTDSGYVQIASTTGAIAALKADGSITAWGHTSYGGSGAPTDSGYVSIASADAAFAALKADGSITAWGNGDIGFGGFGAPTDSGYLSITSASHAFAALKADGSIAAWGAAGAGGSDEPTDSGYVHITATDQGFAALKADGSITAWGYVGSGGKYGGSGAPTDSGYVRITSTIHAFAALKADGSITAWGGYSGGGGIGAPTDSGYISIASTYAAFAALKADGSITAWGNTNNGGIGAPTDSGYVSIASAPSAFAALKADGSITAWGYVDAGGIGAPTDSGYVSIDSNFSAFATLKADGSITAWGDPTYGGSGAPTDSGYVSINGVGPNTSKDCSFKRDSNLDSDSDGMPDWYEDKYGLNKNDPADALLDKDGDGLTNKQEFLLATNPTDPATQSGFLNVAPATPLDFGSVVIGQTSSNQNISVANTGNALLSFTCATTPPFNLTFGNCAFDLAPNEFADLAVNFSPTAEGTFNGAVSFTSNSGNTSRSVTGNGIIIDPPLDSPILGIEPVGQIEFGPVTVGQVNSKTVTIRNTGSGRLTGRCKATKPFYAGIFVCTYDLGPNESEVVDLMFRPTIDEIGQIEGTVQFDSNAGSLTLSLTGVGIEPPIEAPAPFTKASTIWGIFIGLYDGQDGSEWGAFKYLRGAHGEEIANDLKQAFAKNIGVPADQLRIITNETIPVTKIRIKSAIDNTIRDMKENDTLVIYLGSHGSFEGLSNVVIGGYEKANLLISLLGLESSLTDEITFSKGDEYLTLDSERLHDDELASWLREASANKSINTWAFVDACFSGGFWGADPAKNGQSSDEGDLSRIPNIGFIAASPETDVSYGDKINGKSFFGQGLIDAFSLSESGYLKADKNADGALSLYEIYNYIDSWWKNFIIEKKDTADTIPVGFNNFTFSNEIIPLSSATFSPMMFTSEGFNGRLPRSLPNQAPISNAGIDQTVPIGITVILNGSGSNDPDNAPEPLTYSWVQTSGPDVTLNDANTAKSSFTPTEAGSYVFDLIVRDGQADSVVDSVTITALYNFKVKQLLINKKLKSFFLLSNFTLGTENNGINPVKEAVTFKIGNFTSTIPTGSFRKVTTALFAYAGTINKVKLEATITSLGNNRYAFQAGGIGVDFSRFTNPATVDLSIGDDNGTTSAQAIIK